MSLHASPFEASSPLNPYFSGTNCKNFCNKTHDIVNYAYYVGYSQSQLIILTGRSMNESNSLTVTCLINSGSLSMMQGVLPK